MAGNGHWHPRDADKPLQQVCLLPPIAGNGPNAIFQFRFDEHTGHLFSLDPEGHFLFAAGSASNRLAAYRVNSDTGALTPLGTYDIGKRPMWVLITRLGG